jgi:spermidine synthase
MEIDGDLVDVVERDLEFDRGDDVEIIVGDGRLSIRELPADSADVVIGDAFGSRAVPFHLATREFIEELDVVLRGDGIYAANIIDGPDERFVKAYAATVAEVYEHVVVVRGPGPLQGFRGNSALVASHEPIDVDGLQDRLDADVDPSDTPEQSAEPDRVVGEIVTGDALADYLRGAEVITDDYAPVDQLLAGAS